jgi:hypothetical protein
VSIVSEARFVTLTGRDLSERTGALLGVAQSLVEEQVRRKLASATYTQTLPVKFLPRYGRFGCFPQNTPVTSVSAPASAEVRDNVVLVSASDAWLGSEVINGFDVDDEYPATHFVNLTYVGGYTDVSVPVILALAIANLAAAMEDSETGAVPAGAKEVRLDGAAVLFASPVSYADSLVPGLSDALRPYRYRGSVTV